MKNDKVKALRKVSILINRAKKERDKRGYRENLGYDSQGELEEYLSSLNLSYPERARIVETFYRECDKI